MKKHPPQKANGKPAENVCEVSISLLGSSHPFNYLILQSEVERLEGRLEDESEHEGFYQIEVHGHWNAWINIKHLVFIRILKPWPALEGYPAEPTEPGEMSDQDFTQDTWLVRLWLEGQSNPLICDGITKADWNDIWPAFANEAKFLNFEDEDGEFVYVKTDRILAAEAVNKDELSAEELNKLNERKV